MQRINAKSNGAGSGGSFGAAEFLAYRADANDSRADKEKYSKIPAPWRRNFARWRKEAEVEGKQTEVRASAPYTGEDRP